jgi:hypothetical protein
MSKFVDFDPLNGVAMYEDMYDGKLQFHYRQDVEPLLEYTKALRNSGATDSGIKRDMWHYAQIPPVIIMEMKNKWGVDLFNRDHEKKVFELINREYPFLKTTTKHHSVRN